MVTLRKYPSLYHSVFLYPKHHFAERKSLGGYQVEIVNQIQTRSPPALLPLLEKPMVSEGHQLLDLKISKAATWNHSVIMAQVSKT